MADNEGVAVLPEEASLLNGLNFVASDPNRSVSKNHFRYRQLMDARPSVGMFSDGRSKTLADRRGKGHDTDISAWEQLWFSMRL